MFVGLRDWERDEIKVRQQKYGIKHLTPEETKEPKEASSSEETDAGTEAAEETSPDAAAEEEPEPEKKGFFSFFK